MTKWFFNDTSAEGCADGVSGFDLTTVQGTPTVLKSFSQSSPVKDVWYEIATFDVSVGVSGTDGTHYEEDAFISNLVTGGFGNQLAARVRLQRLNSSCVVQESSEYQTDDPVVVFGFPATGHIRKIIGSGWTPTWSTGDILRVSFEIKTPNDTSGNPIGLDISTNFASSWLDERGIIVSISSAIETNTSLSVIRLKEYDIDLAVETNTAFGIQTFADIGKYYFSIENTESCNTDADHHDLTKFQLSPDVLELNANQGTSWVETGHWFLTVGNISDPGKFEIGLKFPFVPDNIETGVRVQRLNSSCVVQDDSGWTMSPETWDGSGDVNPSGIRNVYFITTWSAGDVLKVSLRSRQTGFAGGQYHISVNDPESDVTYVRNVIVGLATETDTANGVNKIVIIPLASETNTAFGIIHKRTYNLGLFTETVQAFTPTIIKTSHPGIAIETDIAQSVIPRLPNILAVQRAEETDISLSLTSAKLKLVGLSTETDTAFVATPVTIIPVELSTETDTTFAVTWSKLKQVALSTEIDTANSIGILRSLPVVQAVETDTTFSVSTIVTVLVGQSSETDSSFSVTTVKTITTGLSIETDTATVTTWSKILHLGLSTETDTVFSVVVHQPILVGLSSETNTAFDITFSKSVPVGLSSETDTAFSTTWSKILHIGLSTETDTGFVVVLHQSTNIGLATETDTALQVDGHRFELVGLSQETSSAQSVQSAKEIDVGLSTETSSSFSVQAGEVHPVGISTETTTTFPVTWSKVFNLALITSTETALGITSDKVRLTGLSTETDTASVNTPQRTYMVGSVSETDTTTVVGILKTVLVSLVTEINTIFSVTFSSSVQIVQATETNTAFDLAGSTKVKSLGLAIETDTALACSPRLLRLEFGPISFVSRTADFSLLS